MGVLILMPAPVQLLSARVGSPWAAAWVQGRQNMTPGGGDVMSQARLERGDPHGVAGMVSQHLDVGAKFRVLAGIPQVAGIGIADRNLVGADQGPVQAHEGLALLPHPPDDLTKG